MVLLSHHFQLLQPYSAVETGTTFFSLPSFPAYVLAAVLGKARHFCWRGRWQVKRVVKD